MALTDNLISWWTLDEASGTRVDSHGSNDLSDNNTVGSGTALVAGNAADFVAANSEYLDNTSPSGGLVTNGDLTISAWVYIDSLASTRTLIDTRTGLNRPYGVFLLTDGDIQLSQRNSANSGFNSVTSTSQPLSAATKHHIIIMRDSSASTVSMYVDNSDVLVGESYTGGVITPSGNPLEVGRQADIANNYMDGRFDELAVWSRTLSSSERSELWNSGSGITYTDFAGGGGARNVFKSFARI